MNFYTDKPILKRTEDLLKRDNFALRISKFLLTKENNDSIVISINGKWGSGKTSLINLIKNNIVELSSDNKTNTPMLIDFSPWNAMNEEQLISQFLSTIQTGFSLDSYYKFLNLTTKMLSTTEKVISYVPLSFPVDKVLNLISKSFAGYSKSIKEKSNDLNYRKEKVIQKLERSPIRYIVFIDDIDRLNNKEIILLVQLIKSICNFPNVTYFLSFDKDIVAGALKNEQSEVDGYRYLEKIVQAEFNLPKIKFSTLMGIVSKDLDKLLGDNLSEDFSNELSTYYSFGLFSQFNNIREVRRFINRLKFDIETYKKEIDLADLIAITYLRCQDDRIIDLFSHYQDHLIGLVYYDKSSKSEEIKNQFFKEVSQMRFSFDEKFEFFLKHLFPSMFSYKTDFTKEYLKKRLCCKECFHKYLQADKDDDDFLYDELNNILSFKNKTDLLTFATQIENGDQGRRILHILDVISETETKEMVFKIIFNFLFNGLSAIKFNRPFYYVEKDYFIKNICFNCARRFGQQAFEKLIIDSLSNYKDVYSLCVLLDYINQSKGDQVIVTSSEFKEAIYIKTKEEIFKLLALDEITFSFKPEYIIKICIDYFKHELTELITKKDIGWVINLITNSIYVSWVHSDKKYLLFGYDYDRLESVIDLEDIDFMPIIRVEKNYKLKQRLVVLQMQKSGLKGPEQGMFYASDIQKYCEKNNIDFIASDKYED